MRRAERQAQTRRAVLEAAERLFRVRGFGPTSIDDIAAEAGFSKGAVYSNFTSKTDLYFAVMEGRYARMSDELRKALESEADRRAQVMAITAWYRRNMQSESSWTRSLLDLASIAQHDAAANKRLQALMRSIEQTITDLLHDVQEQLDVKFRLAPEQISALSIAMVSGLAIRRLLDHETTDDLFNSAMTALLVTTD